MESMCAMGRPINIVRVPMTPDATKVANSKAARTAIRGSALRVVALAATTVVAFFLMPFLVHSLGDRTYGFWALAGTILGYYGLLDLGIVSAVQFHVASAAGEKDTR